MINRRENLLQNSENSLMIRTLETLDEIFPLESLQECIWGYGKSGTAPLYPARALFAISRSGGHVGGAFLNNQLIGFSVAWIGRIKEHGIFYLHSQLVGVREEYRGASIGYQLKLQQREYALTHKLDLIKWTFDPLASVNAKLNIHKIGAVIQKYQPNYYSKINSNFNRNLPSDRVWAEWHITSWRVKKRLINKVSARQFSEIQSHKITSVLTKKKRPERGALFNCDLEKNDRELLIEIPTNYQFLIKKKPNLVLKWQTNIRKVLQYYLEQGYTVTDFLTLPPPQSSSYYLMERDSLLNILRC